MARLSPERRRSANRSSLVAPAARESEHIYSCPTCGQQVDRRKLGDVIHHESLNHAALPAEPGPEALRFVPTMQPTLVGAPPEGDGWLHEIKYDGYRTQIHLQDRQVRIYTRNAYDWTERYRPLAQAAAELACSSAILDGEVILQDAQGRSNFGGLREAIAKQPERLVFMAFDLLHLDGRDLRNLPVEDRRARLERLVAPADPRQPIHFSEALIGEGAEVFAAADRLGLEGIVSKKLGSRYVSGHSKRWLKTKTFTEKEFVVIGTSKGDRAPVALLGRETKNGLDYAGGAMVTLPQPQRDRFWETAERLRADNPPLAMEPRKETGWLRPEMRVRVKTLRGEELARHATVTAILDEPPHQVRKARSQPVRSIEPRMNAPSIDRHALRDYYEVIAPVMLEWVAGRPLNLVRCSGRSCWFQRNLNHPPTDSAAFGSAVGRSPIHQKNGRTEDYLHIQSVEGLLQCVDADTVEFHGWGSLIGNVELPDRLVIDLDPDEGLEFAAVRGAAVAVREALQKLGLESFPLLTGGKGVHVVVPLTPKAHWDEVRAFALRFCAALAELNPELFTVALPKKERAGRIFLDYLRNGRTATAVLPYSARARKGLPIAAPITWRELSNAESSARFAISDAALLAKRAKSKALKGWGRADQVLPAVA